MLIFLKKTIIRYNPANGEEHKLIIDEGQGGSVSFVIPIESHLNKYVIGLGESINILEWDGLLANIKSQDLKKMCQLNTVIPTMFNDGKCDSKGRLWAGSLLAGKFDVGSRDGSLYQINIDGKVTKHVDGLQIANGLAWSPDNKTFYYIDSGIHTVDAFDYNLESGEISSRRVIFDLKAHNVLGIADGMCIDVNGNLWVAVFGGSRVIHINPTNGKLIDWIELPAKNITSCTFGGSNLDELYVTSGQFQFSLESSNDGMIPDEAPEAGSLFKVTNIGTRGTPGGICFKGKI